MLLKLLVPYKNSFLQQKNPRKNPPGVLSTYELFVFFSHPDFTVGSGIPIT